MELLDVDPTEIERVASELEREAAGSEEDGEGDGYCADIKDLRKAATWLRMIVAK